MENRTVWTIRYKIAGNQQKAEYFCLTEKQAIAMFRKDNGDREIISILDWRDDMRKYGN